MRPGHRLSFLMITEINHKEDIFKTIETKRLLLRPFEAADADALYALANDPKISDTTTLPYPYPEGAAAEWIATHAQLREDDTQYIFAVILRAESRLIGCASILNVSRLNSRANLGYWIGTAFWGNGYATEAAKELVRFGFQTLEFNRIAGVCLARNPASARVLEKSGLKYEGCLRQYREKNKILEDCLVFGLLKHDPR